MLTARVKLGRRAFVSQPLRMRICQCVGFWVFQVLSLCHQRILSKILLLVLPEAFSLALREADGSSAVYGDTPCSGFSGAFEKGVRAVEERSPCGSPVSGQKTGQVPSNIPS